MLFTFIHFADAFIQMLCEFVVCIISECVCACRVLGGARRLFLKRSSTRSARARSLTMSAVSAGLEPAVDFGSVRCARVCLCVYGRGSDRLCGGTQPCQRFTSSSGTPWGRGGHSAAACVSGSFRSCTQRTNRWRSSKAWPNIEEEGRGAGDDGRGRQTAAALRVYY